MKGEIIRRMSMEIINEEGVNNPFKMIDKEKGKADQEDDYLMKTIGAFGIWQATVSVTVSLTRAIAVWNMMSIVFLTPVSEYVCVVFSDNVTTEVNNSTCYDNCVKYKCSSAMGRSIIEDFQLVCRNAWLAGFAQYILMVGSLVGVLLFGWISDRFGRRMSMLLSTILNAVFMIALPFSPSYIVFAPIRFMIGAATGGSLLISVVQIMEIIGKPYREIAGVCILIPDCLAHASLAGFAYFTSTWQSYMWSYDVATCLVLFLILFVPESPRWLMANGKVDEAIKVITSAANRNKLNTSTIKDEVTKASEEMKLTDGGYVKVSYFEFFKSRTLFIPTLVIFIIWFALGMCYCDIYQNVTIIKFDPYLIVVILGLIQIPVFPVGVILNRRFGRQIAAIVMMICESIVMLSLIFVHKGHWLSAILGIIGFAFTNICFSIFYVHMSELYPTRLRTMSFGLASSAAQIGAMITPLVANLLPKWVPSLIFFLSALLAGLCCFALTETKGRNLRDTLLK